MGARRRILEARAVMWVPALDVAANDRTATACGGQFFGRVHHVGGKLPWRGVVVDERTTAHATLLLAVLSVEKRLRLLASTAKTIAAPERTTAKIFAPFSVIAAEVIRLSVEERATPFCVSSDGSCGVSMADILDALNEELATGILRPHTVLHNKLVDYIASISDAMFQRIAIATLVGRSRISISAAIRDLRIHYDQTKWLTSLPLGKYMIAGLYYLRSCGIDFDFLDTIYAAEDRCESVLEAKFMRSVVESSEPMWPVRAATHAIDGRLVADLGSDGMFYQQVKVGSFRLDFAIVQTHARHGGPIMVAAEVDGHDYHSSKEQLARDKSRDREITANGWHILRFTGSEIHADPLGCAQELLEAADRLAEHPRRRSEYGQWLVTPPWDIDPDAEFEYQRSAHQSDYDRSRDDDDEERDSDADEERD